MITYVVVGMILFAILFAFSWYYSRVFSLKIATVTVLFAIANMIYFSFDSFKGWPTNDTIPRGQLLNAVVREPAGEYPGAIYLLVQSQPRELTWIEELVTYTYWDPNAPRYYAIPYSEEGNQKMREAQQAIEDGFIVEIGEQPSEESGTDGNGEEGTKAEGQTGNIGSAENYRVPHLELVDPRDSSGKKQQ